VKEYMHSTTLSHLGAKKKQMYMNHSPVRNEEQSPEDNTKVQLQRFSLLGSSRNNVKTFHLEIVNSARNEASSYLKTQDQSLIQDEASGRSIKQKTLKTPKNTSTL
jgi:hypothetical protein